MPTGMLIRVPRVFLNLVSASVLAASASPATVSAGTYTSDVAAVIVTK